MHFSLGRLTLSLFLKILFVLKVIGYPLDPKYGFFNYKEGLQYIRLFRSFALVDDISLKMLKVQFICIFSIAIIVTVVNYLFSFIHHKTFSSDTKLTTALRMSVQITLHFLVYPLHSCAFTLFFRKETWSDNVGVFIFI
jgi:hypothetical protein